MERPSIRAFRNAAMLVSPAPVPESTLSGFIASLKSLSFPVCKIHARRAALNEEAGSPHPEHLPRQGPDVLLHADDRGHIPACRPGQPLLIAGSVRHKAEFLHAGNKVVHIGEHFFQDFSPSLPSPASESGSTAAMSREVVRPASFTPAEYPCQLLPPHPRTCAA